jgi:VWFA-related protein
LGYRLGLTAFADGSYTDIAGRLPFRAFMLRHIALMPAMAVAAALAVVSTTAPRTVNAQPGARERTLYTSVVDKDGEPVSGLSADEFIVREDNARREVLRVSRAVEPMAVAVLVDNSASADSAIQNLRDGLSKFVQELDPAFDVALIGIADRPTILQDYTRNKELLRAAVGRVFAQPGSGMMLLESLIEVSRGLSRRDEPRASIVAILTDGVEFSNQHYSQVLDALAQSGAAFHALAIGTFAATTQDELRNRAVVLDQGPRQTGGQRVPLLSSMGVGSALGKLARELASQYKVVYGRPESLIQPSAVTVSVTRPGLTARGTPERRKPGA